MKAVRCTNGHYFDGDMYVVCPHCGAEIGSVANSQAKKQGGLNILSRAGSSERVEKAPSQAPEGGMEQKSREQAEKAFETDTAEQLKEAIKQSSSNEDGKTLSFFSMMSGASQANTLMSSPQQPAAGQETVKGSNH